jgi:sulfhydrogenase subunit beta (sulfur reductase)
MSSKNISGYRFPKKDIKKLIETLREFGDVYAPQKDENGWIRLEELDFIADISYKGINWYSAKKHVFEQKQILFDFDNNKIKTPEDKSEKKVLFGLRLCDLNSFRINDILFLEQEPENENYKRKRENLVLVGLWCNEAVDEYCFCDSLELEHYYDICLFDRGDYWHIKVGSELGDEIIKKIKTKGDEIYSASLPNCKNKLKTTDIEKYFNRDDVWKEGSSKCLSCGNCTSLCPTCLCFDIEDDVNLDLKSGQRIAKWDSCMYRDFTIVAGNNVFRDNRVNRFKHRIFHKLDYFKKKTGTLMCTGCGRCIRGCPTKIDWVELINKLESEQK